MTDSNHEEALHRRALRLEWFTVLWNVIEAVVAIVAGVIAGSTALVAFGADSLIEVTSAVGLMTHGMKGSLFTCLTTLLVIGFAAAAESQGMMGGNCMGMMGGSSGSMARHHQFMMGGVPEAYRSLTNPLPANTEVISRGRAIYGDHCVSCHGPSGLGDGEDGRELSPRPANLACLSRMPMMMDDSYLYWTIAEGGGAFGTAMPAHKDTLSADEIWSVIRFLQGGLPPS